MSRFLCKKEEVGIAIFQIQVIEDAEDDPFHAGSILKNPYGPCSSSHLSKRSLYEIGGSDLSPERQGELFLPLLGFASEKFFERTDLVKLEEMVKVRCHCLYRSGISVSKGS